MDGYVWNNWREENRDVRPHLIGADLSMANLIEADLIGVDLSRADLSGAVLRGADLTGADLSWTMNLTQKQIDSAITKENTKLPDDLK